MTVNDCLKVPIIKLIDWGRSIDMITLNNAEFIGKAGTDCFDCFEMIVNTNFVPLI